jgi:hypothetical protein
MEIKYRLAFGRSTLPNWVMEISLAILSRKQVKEEGGYIDTKTVKRSSHPPMEQ